MYLVPIYDYVCPNEHKTEQRGSYEAEEILCPECGTTASRVPFYLSQSIQGETVSIPLGERQMGFFKRDLEEAREKRPEGWEGPQPRTDVPQPKRNVRGQKMPEVA